MSRLTAISPRVLIAAAALALLAPVAAASAAPARSTASQTASTKRVAVIPADPASSIVNDRLVVAGTTGFLWHPATALTDVWTTYATGRTEAVKGLPPNSVVMSAGGDSVWFWPLGPATPGEASKLDLATMTWTHWTIPATDTQEAVYGDSVIAESESGGAQSLQVLTFSGSSYTTTPVTGLPAGATLAWGDLWVGDAAGAVLPYTVSGQSGTDFGMLDLATGVVTTFASGSGGVILTPTIVAIHSSSTVSLYQRSDLTASPQVVPVGAEPISALTGDMLVGVPAELSPCLGGSGCPMPTAPADFVRIPGGQTGTALPEALAYGTEGILEAADGSVLMIGGNGTGTFAVRLLTARSDGTLADRVVLPLNYPLHNAGLDVTHGIVQHVEAGPATGATPTYWLFSHAVRAGKPASVTTADGGMLYSPVPCKINAACVRLSGDTSGGLPYLSSTNEATSSLLTYQLALYQEGFGGQVGVPSGSGYVADTSAGFLIVDGSHPSRQYVYAVGDPTPEIIRKVTGAALSGNTLWSSDGRGRIQAMNLLTKAKSKPVATGAHCTATALQAAQSWVYWTCGARGPAGVYFEKQHTDIRVRAGLALLGDGYLVRQQGHDLIGYRFGARRIFGPVTLATDVAVSPTPDGRGITWAVDKYGTDVAYVTSGDAVVVVSG